MVSRSSLLRFSYMALATSGFPASGDSSVIVLICMACIKPMPLRRAGIGDYLHGDGDLDED